MKFEVQAVNVQSPGKVLNDGSFWCVAALLIVIGTCGSVSAQAGDRANRECEPTALEMAQRAQKSNDLAHAERLANALVECPEPLGGAARAFLRDINVHRQNLRKMAQAQALFHRNENPSLACALLREIQESDPEFAGLQEALRQASCPSEIDSGLKRIEGLVGQHRFVEARRGLANLSGQYRDNPWILDEIKDLEERLDVQIGSSVEASYADAQRRLSQNDLAGARRAVDSVLRLDRQHSGAIELKARIDRAIQSQEREESLEQHLLEAESLAAIHEYLSARESLERALLLEPDHEGANRLKSVIDEYFESANRDLSLALNGFYSGSYAEAARQLTEFLLRGHPKDVQALGYFYLAASLASRFLLEENDPDSAALLEEARDAYQSIANLAGDFRPPFDAVSPRIRSFLLEEDSLTDEAFQ